MRVYVALGAHLGHLVDVQSDDGFAPHIKDLQADGPYYDFDLLAVVCAKKHLLQRSHRRECRLALCLNFSLEHICGRTLVVQQEVVVHSTAVRTDDGSWR